MSATTSRDLVIVLDDDPQLLPMTKRVLCRFGLRVETALSANALRQLDPALKAQAGVLLCDASIVDLNHAIEHIRSAAPGIKIVHISGHQREHLTSMGMEIDPDRFVAKPWRGAALAELISGLLAQQ